MDFWTPPHDAPHLLEWWRPLMLASRRARAEWICWPIHIDEFRLVGRVKRQRRPDVWIYEHPANGGGIYVDAEGETYKFTPTPNARGMGHFRPCAIRTAVWRAGLPEVVESISYEQPSRHWADDELSPPADLPRGDGPAAPAAGGETTTDTPMPARHRRGHLTVIDCSA